jgi:four helix bundle protein
VHDFERLRVWRDAIGLAETVYLVTRRFPKAERFGMASQIQRAAVSVASNIAEGAGRGSNADFKRFLHIATASANEVASCAVLAGRLGWLKPDDHQAVRKQTDAIKRQLRALADSLQSS